MKRSNQNIGYAGISDRAIDYMHLDMCKAERPTPQQETWLAEAFRLLKEQTDAVRPVFADEEEGNERG